MRFCDNMAVASRIWQLAVNLPPHLRVFAASRCIQQSCNINTDLDSWSSVLQWSCESEDFGKLASREWAKALGSSLCAIISACASHDKLGSDAVQLRRWEILAFIFCVRSRKLRKHVVALSLACGYADQLAALRSCIRNLECKNVRVWCHSLRCQSARGWRPCHEVPAGVFEMIATRRCQSMTAASYHLQAWAHVTSDVLKAVMGFLRPRALCRISSVCKYWNAAVSSCPVWNTLYSKTYGGIIQCDHASSFKVCRNVHCVRVVLSSLNSCVCVW